MSRTPHLDLELMAIHLEVYGLDGLNLRQAARLLRSARFGDEAWHLLRGAGLSEAECHRLARGKHHPYCTCWDCLKRTRAFFVSLKRRVPRETRHR